MGDRPLVRPFPVRPLPRQSPADSRSRVVNHREGVREIFSRGG